MVQKAETISPKIPGNTTELVRALQTSMSTLNCDIYRRIDMPKGAGVDKVLSTLKEDFPDLERALSLVRAGERPITGIMTRRRKRIEYEAAKRIVEDLSYAVGTNPSSLDNIAQVGPHEYVPGQTRVGDIVLTFYDILLSPSTNGRNNFYARMRARKLSEQPKFILSPLMKAVR